MTCDTTRAAILAARDDAWPAAAQAHLAGCDDCAAFVVEWTLRQVPPVVVPPTFAVDVARTARLEPLPASTQSIAPAIGLATAGCLLVGALAWFLATEGPLPAAALLLASGEAIVLAAWSLAPDRIHAFQRP
jgi:hypothetical protein